MRIGPGLLFSCGEILREVLPSRRAAVVTDSTVGPLYLDRVRQSMERAGFSVCTCTFPAGEEHKNLETLGDILDALGSARLTRADALLALGGGVVGDMAGFAAAVYLRGIRYVQLPTTLLSAVDSSVGGKTAVDLRAGKNLAGAFLQPAAVLCDTDCLSTLPPDTLADGAAEAVKTGVLEGEDLFSRLERGNLLAQETRTENGTSAERENLQENGAQLKQGALSPDVPELIARCVAYKAGVVERDEREQNERRLLNLGHTVGHAIEKCSHYEIPHGHAVAAGLGVIARASAALGWSDAGTAARIVRCLERYGLPAGTDFPAEDLAEAALSDKKRAGDAFTLAVPEKIGRCVLRTIPVTDLPSVIRAGLS
ncbi:MAG: 3-dehydroquinate synthase [Oscillibacter sp.]|nr:3-dehydroquinate synthase [Oscillibacter sp.]